MRRIVIIDGADGGEVGEAGVAGAQREAPSARGTRKDGAAATGETAGEIVAVVAEAGGDAKPGVVKRRFEVGHESKVRKLLGIGQRKSAGGNANLKLQIPNKTAGDKAEKKTSSIGRRGMYCSFCLGSFLCFVWYLELEI